MTDKATGGPAFPFAATDPSNMHMQAPGMTLRDWFAGQALVMVATHSKSIGALAARRGKEHGEVVAEVAYKIADAMMEARK
jgi:hypothetical protein